MSKRLETLRKRSITILIIRSIGLFIIAIMLFVGAFIAKSKTDDNNVFIFLIILALLGIFVMIFNIIYEYQKYLKKDWI